MFTSKVEQLQKLTDKLEEASEKAPILTEIVSEFPYFFGYWGKLIQIDNHIDLNDVLAKCPSIEMYKICLPSLLSTYNSEIIDLILKTVGYHFYAGPIFIELYEQFKEIKILHMAMKIPLYDYGKVFQLCSDLELYDTDELLEKSRQIKQEVKVIWEFESRLKHDFFHVFEISKEELMTWAKYLKYTIDIGNVERTNALFQRCLISTALYVDFWLMWIKWILIEREKGVKLDLIYVLKQALHYHPQNTVLRTAYLREMSNSNLDAEADKLYLELAFDDPVNPQRMFPMYMKGICPNPAKYAMRLREAGAYKEFFEVDKSLKYNE